MFSPCFKIFISNPSRTRSLEFSSAHHHIHSEPFFCSIVLTTSLICNRLASFSPPWACGMSSLACAWAPFLLAGRAFLCNGIANYNSASVSGDDLEMLVKGKFLCRDIPTKCAHVWICATCAVGAIGLSKKVYDFVVRRLYMIEFFWFRIEYKG